MLQIFHFSKNITYCFLSSSGKCRDSLCTALVGIKIIHMGKY